jgi:hypothetical protein
MTSDKTFNSIYVIMLFDWMQHLSDMVMRSQTIYETQPSAMTYAPRWDSSVQAVHQEFYHTEGPDHLSKSGLGSQMGVIYS